MGYRGNGRETERARRSQKPCSLCAYESCSCHGGHGVNGVHNEGTKQTKTKRRRCIFLENNIYLRSSPLTPFLRCELRCLRHLRGPRTWLKSASTHGYGPPL